ncbi:hypothetical protein BDN70DRAFT_996465 [Pholiota conissans]|uniref:Uncharacterized protein n=1 Tax=Pholiota conissans TaxID=109636 RepID=A0A9P5YWU2_9AGAR|nr:hypothetical protein BDN70DRAFT_996465 [Pholiota conissans]
MSVDYNKPPAPIQYPPEFLALQETCKRIVNVPYCSGAVLLNASQSLLFYRSNGEARFVDFAKPDEAQLKALSGACSPASFGRNQEDVRDESYRKAGKMDTTDFSTLFSPWDSGVLKTITESLFKSEGSFANVNAELYKLNVYGPGSFFKAHVDTTRSDTMFGSLVVVLPTPHAGGSLLFMHMLDDLASVLSAHTFLSHGGLLAFELAYKYPFDHRSTRLSYFKKHLKNTDALLKRACDESGLKASLKVLYRVKQNERVAYCFLDKFHSFDDGMVRTMLTAYLSHCEKQIIVGYDVAAPPDLKIKNWRNPPAPLDMDYYAPETEILGVA